MAISAVAGIRIPDGTTARTGLLRTDGASDPQFVGSTAVPGGLLAALGVGGLGIAGGVALRMAGHGRIGTPIAAIGAAILGASLLAACSPRSGPSTPVPGDEGRPGDDVDIVTSSWRDLPAEGSDTTNPAPASWVPQSGTLDAREGVVQVEHRRGLGSGWVVEPGLVVTNYHVAQGFNELKVHDHAGREHWGTVERLDRSSDLALVRVPTLRDTPLPMDDVVEDIEFGETTGYPGGHFRNDEAFAAARIDVIDDGRRRESLLLLGQSQQGVSGGPVINGAGEVIGTAFAVGELTGDDDPTDFVLAIPNDQVRALLDRTRAADRPG
jgi:hypothetical protein